jgi:hypothetical protein
VAIKRGDALTIGVLGMRWILAEPAILKAVSPHRALIYLVHAPPAIAFAVLGAVFLAVTGGEAMYTDIYILNPARTYDRRAEHIGKMWVTSLARC